MKTEASRKPVPMEQVFAEVLASLACRECIQPARRRRLCFNQDARQATDFAEQRNGGSHPTCSEAGRDCETDRLAYAQTQFGTLLKANDEDMAKVEALMRHANVSVCAYENIIAVE